MNEILNAQTECSVSVLRGAAQAESTGALGRYHAVCHDSDGNLKWEDDIENTIMNEGKNYLLDNGLAGSSFTTSGPRMGLVTNTSFTAYNVTDTYAAHTSSGWTESANYSGGRKLAVWSASSGGSKSLSAGLAFAITGTDTIRGCCMFFTAVTTAADVGGTGVVLSAGDFTGGNKGVSGGDTITVSYSFSI